MLVDAKETIGSKAKQLKLDKELLMKLAPLFSLILLCVFFSFASPYFFVLDNFMTIALQTAVIGIMAIGVPTSLSQVVLIYHLAL